MPYNETFEKLKAAQNPAFAEEIEAVKDNQTFFIGAYESSSEGNIPKGDFNEIFQALLNNDKALKKLAEAIQARTITAGNGLQGGGNLTADRTINVASADDSITVGVDNIKVNTYNGVDSTSITRPASANAVKQANDNANGRVPKTTQVIAGNGLQGGGALSENTTLNIVSANDGITVNTNDIKLNIVDNMTTDSGTRAGSARQIKLLNENKEPKITKKTGFNLDKSDATNSSDSTTLATSKAVKDTFDRTTANMGTTQNGIFPLTSAIVGNTYRATNGKLYKCVKAYSGTSISVPNANFEELSVHENFNKISKQEEFIIISFGGNGTYSVVKNTFKNNVIIDGNGVIRLPTSQLSSIWARGKIGDKAYGFGIYEGGLSGRDNLIAFDSRKMEDISVLTCLYHGNKIRVSNIIMSTSSVGGGDNMNYNMGDSADDLKYPTIVTISTLSRS